MPKPPSGNDALLRALIGATGNGLTICESLVEAHDGRMSLEAEEGQGACFRILLRAATVGCVP